LSGSGTVLGIFHEEPEKAMAGFRKFMEQDNDDKCLEDEPKQRKTDNQVKAEIEILMNDEPIGRLQAMERTKRNPAQGQANGRGIVAANSKSYRD